MPALIQVLAGPDRGRSFALEAGSTTQIGRGTTTATQLTDPSVSRLHCEIACDAGGRAVLSNLSDNGTTVNGEKVTRQELRHGDLVAIGGTTLRYLLSELEEAETIMQPLNPP
jgi:pSer/pThr/pTyr-binding forkhead associated (FHA) protein